MATVVKNKNILSNRVVEIKRDLKAWRALRGVLRGKKIVDPVAWQKRIRKEWERSLP